MLDLAQFTGLVEGVSKVMAYTEAIDGSPDCRITGNSRHTVEWGRDSYEVKALSPYDRFMIVLHSPEGIGEVGLCIWPPEKSARKLASGIRRHTFSSAV